MKRTEEIFSEWLVIGCQQGDKKAFELLVKQWQPKVIRQAQWHSKDGRAAKDISQETWTSVIKGINTLKDPARFPVWLHQIVFRKSADWIRSKQKERKINVEEVKASLHSEEYDDSDKVNQVLKNLQELEGDQKFILTLFYLEERNLIEISEILAIPVGTVKSRLFTAREQLKKRLKEKGL
ncbi:MAG: RNA polymerase sigma factor [Cyclobacteriaceae bacterium]